MTQSTRLSPSLAMKSPRNGSTFSRAPSAIFSAARLMAVPMAGRILRTSGR